MPIVNGPLFSLSGKKTVAKTLVYYRRKGQDIVRQRVVPENPNTAAQQAQRSLFGDVSQGWRSLSAKVKAGWDALAVNPLSGFNLFSQNNLDTAGSAPLGAVAIAGCVGTLDAVDEQADLVVTGQQLYGGSGNSYDYTVYDVASGGADYEFTKTQTTNDGNNAFSVDMSAAAIAAYPDPEDWAVKAVSGTGAIALPPVNME